MCINARDPIFKVSGRSKAQTSLLSYMPARISESYMELAELLYLPDIEICYLSYLLHCCTFSDKRLSHGMCIYQVMMTLYFLNDVANDAESTQKSKITS